MHKRRGQTLMEVMVATVIAAISATAVFSVVLSTSVSAIKTDKREAAALMFKTAQETLKNYVSAVPTEAAYVPNGGKWSADTSGLKSWALANGTHDISSLLLCPYAAGDPRNPVLNANCNSCTSGSSICSFTYTVATYNCDYLQCKQVSFALKYTD